ncbi:HAD family hydrolase [Streptomyces sp. NPDC005012]|uniref:HAD family hydrolase n=1 Tax=Streptomyces sp. NPDC005012 TaxID=3154558 RepID=UPI0033A3099E
MDSDGLLKVLADSDAILFDFDGPICDVFAGLPAPDVAHELAALLQKLAPDFAAAASSTDDPMVVHQLSAQAGEGVLDAVEAALTAAEVRAVAAAGVPTVGAAEALRAARASGRRVAVVSNNSAECVRAYLAARSLAGVVDAVVGRPSLRPDLMKPSPHLLLEAASLLSTPVERATLIGDSVTDVLAARAAVSRSIGYANRAGKGDALRAAGADAIVFAMDDVAGALGDA